MRTIFFIALILSVSLVVEARIRYIVPPSHAFPGMAQGDDNADGSFATPWATLQKAFDESVPGDTTYIRGGVYYFDNPASLNPKWPYAQARHGYDGTADSVICYFNYPDEWPIFDGTNSQAEDFNDCIGLSYTDFIHFRGFEIRNWFQGPGDYMSGGIGGTLGSNITYENIVVHDVNGRAFGHISAVGDASAPGVTYWIFPADSTYPYYIEYDTTRFINCDAYNCFDSLSSDPGNGADGFKVGQWEGAYIELHNCRAWKCSDDGFDINETGVGVFDSCWSFANGFIYQGNPTEGNGFKIGFVGEHSDYTGTYNTRYITNCISAENNVGGYHDAVYQRSNQQHYNNISISNGYSYYQATADATGTLSASHRNNIFYDNAQNLLSIYNTDGSNTYQDCDGCQGGIEDNPSFSVSAADFVGPIDSITICDQLSGPRGADFSLPIITCLQLSEGSDLINGGTNVGLPFNGSAPDLGPFESNFSPESLIKGITGQDGKFLIGLDGNILRFRE